MREHLVVAALGVLAGGVLGLAAAQAALPDVPLFAVAAVKLPVVLDPAWEAVALTIGACLVVLCAVSVVVGRGARRGRRPSPASGRADEDPHEPRGRAGEPGCGWRWAGCGSGAAPR